MPLLRRSSTDLPFFAGWRRRELDRWRRTAELVDYEPGECLAYRGSYAKELVVLISGAADLVVGGHRVGAFTPGMAVGQEVLRHGGPARETVVARHLCRAWVLSAGDFTSLWARQPSLRAALQPTSAVVLLDRSTPAAVPAQRSGATPYW